MSGETGASFAKPVGGLSGSAWRRPHGGREPPDPACPTHFCPFSLSYVTHNMGSGGPTPADPGRSMDLGHLLPTRPPERSGLLCVLEKSGEDSSVSWGLRGAERRKRQGLGGMLCGFRGSPPPTGRSQSSAPPPDDSGELPPPVLSAFPTGSPASFSTGRCKPVRVGKGGPGGPGRPTASRHFPPRMKQYSLIRLTSSSPWAELGTGAAKIRNPGAGRLTVSWDKHTRHKVSCHMMTAAPERIQNIALARRKRD